MRLAPPDTFISKQRHHLGTNPLHLSLYREFHIQTPWPLPRAGHTPIGPQHHRLLALTTMEGSGLGIWVDRAKNTFIGFCGCELSTDLATGWQKLVCYFPWLQGSCHYTNTQGRGSPCFWYCFYKLWLYPSQSSLSLSLALCALNSPMVQLTRIGFLPFASQ
jgi:hypothetical protein